MTVRTAKLTGAALLAAGLLGPGASGAAGPAAVRSEAAAAAPQPTADLAGGCEDRTAQPSSNESGPKVQQIRRRGMLVVGVDQNSYHWGYRNPQTGRIEGFDIDLARAVAKAILGDPDKVTYLTVPTARRIEAIKSGQVDLIARTMTITCERWQDTAFSAPYFSSGQRLVVPKAAKVTGIEQGLRGRRACVADQSSSQAVLRQNPYGTAEVKVVENQLDCLVLMQLGQVDATLTDTVLAAAQVAQDPTVEQAGEPIATAHMGIAMKKEDTDLVARVNQVLVDYRANGGWRASYDHWLAASMGADPAEYLK
ncbi:glutamate ABC transporter substrate-binding protein [Kitasatospora sp. GP82]|uniref:glutamate ABC transporter substrate-binding protein n=1 Tax=Kitasatospora sp. GP82 TaxID=3035089 RepID=UPI002473EB01|nr:glutamate ABC transporter substrate-binding protein [Kitasatospora sp. GP82]MDH6127836.1 polar amino acid transport system substrate-binding protein [Kitasatospora sp. GP82]